tara:strand:+ start:53 stop:550 length:498 start_codon:yes stop_codon:yes gene_type:complete
MNMVGPQASLEIHGPRAGRVEDAIDTLDAIETAYNVIYFTNIQLDWICYFVQREALDPNVFMWPLNMLRSSEDIRQFILPEDVLEIGVVKFESPGFWEFLGALNPLDQIRQFISDRHERSKDIEYRNAAEKKNLNWIMSGWRQRFFQTKSKCSKKLDILKNRSEA